MTPEPQLLSQDSIQQQLFDGLMSEIEPDLMLSNRNATADKLAKMEPRKRKKILKRYQKAYVSFTKRWQEYVDQCDHNVQRFMDTVKEVIKEEEVNEIADIEKQIDSSPDAS